MNVSNTPLPGVLIVDPDIFGDDRGFFFETYNAERYREAGIEQEFVQDNLSYSQRGVLRGLHIQNPGAQGKLVQVLDGEVFDVAVDVRVSSPHFGRWFGISLSSKNKRQLYVPEGFAHGFCVISDTALFHYKCTSLYAPKTEISILWNDPRIGIIWPIDSPYLSKKDMDAKPLDEIEPNRLPEFKLDFV